MNAISSVPASAVPSRKTNFSFSSITKACVSSSSENIERSVPTASFAAGNLSYINNGPGCDGTARLNTNPACITTLTPAQVATLDPAKVGPDQDLLTAINTRPYPAPNDPTGGDGVNSEGYPFYRTCRPSLRTCTLTRVDYSLNSEKHKLFFRGSVALRRGRRQF